jgi:signal transduction histidine kinase
MRERSQNERNAHLLERITVFGSILMRASSVEESAWSVAKHAVAKLGYIDCVIYLINNDGDLYQCAAHGNKNPTAQDIKNPIKLKIGEGICGHVALTGIGEVIADTSKDPRYQVDDADRYSEITVPIISDGLVIGIIDSEHPDKDYFSDYDLNLLTMIASMLSLKVSQTKALEEKDEWLGELVVANKELTFQNEEKAKRANELEYKIKFRTKELEESLEREKELGMLKTNFFSMASHEFRTPLTSIKATSEVIHRYFDKLSRDDIDGRLEKIKSEVDYMMVMLEDILIIGKSESQNLHYDPNIFDIVSLIKHLITEYQLSEYENRNIVYNISPPIIEVAADKKWIKHIVLNLISNAIKYSDNKKPIEITIEQKKSSVSFCFKDYGIGISKKDIKQLFEPFHRGENVGNISGSGLGLSVLKKAVDLHNGKIEVESDVNKGSSFKVTLPKKTS